MIRAVELVTTFIILSVMINSLNINILASLLSHSVQGFSQKIKNVENRPDAVIGGTKFTNWFGRKEMGLH